MAKRQDWAGDVFQFDTPSDGTTFSIAVANRVWDPLNLIWVSETQPGGGGGGSDVQYADGFTTTTPTGTVAMGKNGSDVIHALSLDGSGNLNVNLAAGGTGGGVVTQGTVPWVVDDEQLALQFDATASPVLYLGQATPGSATSAGAWRIQKIDTTSGVSVTWAGGVATFVNAWDNRASLTYS